MQNSMRTKTLQNLTCGFSSKKYLDQLDQGISLMNGFKY